MLHVVIFGVNVAFEGPIRRILRDVLTQEAEIEAKKKKKKCSYRNISEEEEEWDDVEVIHIESPKKAYETGTVTIYCKKGGEDTITYFNKIYIETGGGSSPYIEIYPREKAFLIIVRPKSANKSLSVRYYYIEDSDEWWVRIEEV